MLYKSYGTEETEAIAASIAEKARPGDVFCLYGNLGAGKTAFARGFARGMGYRGEVTSPTFTLVHEYIGGRLPVYHFDLYRLGESARAGEQPEDLGYDEYFYGNGVCLIEWPEVSGWPVPEDARKIKIVPDYDKGAEYREIHDNSFN